MTDLTTDQIIERCRSYWTSSGVAAGQVSDMTTELESHLSEAVAAGKPLTTVIGDDVESFAREWAAESLGRQFASSDGPTDPSLPRTDSRPATWGLWLGAALIVVGVVVIALFGPKDDSLDQALWTGVWFIAAAVLALGEMLTAGFFLLPFAVGAVASGILSVVGIDVWAQIVTFIAVSLIALYLLQQFARRDVHGELLPVGAARYIGATALVLEPVNRLAGTGRVKMGTEDWRATTNQDGDIPAGTEVRVVEVSGARLVVERIDN